MPIDVPAAVAVALRLLEADGLDKLTVRRLAAELGVQAPALYWHFDGKRALLDRMTDVLVRPVVDGLAPAGSVAWWIWLEQAATALHAALLAHRDGALVALGADALAARALGEFIERTVEVLIDAGSTAGDATRAAGVLVHFVLGRAVEDQSRANHPGEDALYAAPDFPFPLLARGMRERAGSTVADDFGYALNVMITGLRVIRSDVGT